MMTSLSDDAPSKMFWTQYKNILTKQHMYLKLNSFRGRKNKY
jgi:hypothetical protein